MERIARFFKVSENRFKEDMKDFEAERDSSEIYRELILPKRATKGSAGYDFFSPVDIELAPGESIKIPTGVRAKMAEGWVLMIFPRSSLGFKYKLQLNNTVGIVDSDYFYSDNEGHIFIKIINDNNEGKKVKIGKNTAFAQGIFLPFGVTEDDEADGERNGGFGSTDRQHQIREVKADAF
ncbi:MAG: deoxyuridine 5'-triphosphate nucleotidohydrolase [Candidatus Avilachnospira sp.]|jgi:dUTP pyrophosphatase